MQPPGSERRFHELDGLRGWGAVFVVLFHVFCSGLATSDFARYQLAKMVPFNGKLAVYVFFLVSGISLSIRFTGTGDRGILVRIAAGRYVRLALPILAACAVVHLALVSGLIDPPAARFPPFREALLFEPSFTYLLRFSLFDVFFAYDSRLTYIGPLWTMSIELLGSFAILGALALLGSWRYRAAAMLAAGVILIALDSLTGMFFFGAVIAEALHRSWIDRLRHWTCVALIALGWLIPIFVPVPNLPLTALAAVALTIGCVGLPAVRAWLSTPTSRWLGEISFPLYLIHGPVMMLFAAPLFMGYGTQNVTFTLWVQIATIAISFMVALPFVQVNNLAILLSRRVGAWVTSNPPRAARA